MGLFQYFTKAEREIRREQRERKAWERRVQAIASGIRSLSNPGELTPGQFILKAMSVEESCGWPPEPDFFWPYVRALGFQAVGYLWLAESVHHWQFYGSCNSFAPTSRILTWRRAAQKARQLAERDKCFLRRMRACHPDYIDEIIGCLDNIMARASKARDINLKEALKIDSFTENRMEQSSIRGMPFGPLGRRYVLPPEIIGAFVGSKGPRNIKMSDTNILEMLNDPKIGRWVTEDVDFSISSSHLESSVTFDGIHVIYADDPSGSYQIVIEKEVQGREDELRGCVVDYKTPLELPRAYGLLVRAEAPIGKYFKIATSGGLCLKGSLPITYECNVTLNETTGSVLFLRFAQGTYEGGSYPLALLQMSHPSALNLHEKVKVVINISDKGMLTITGLNESNNEFYDIKQII